MADSPPADDYGQTMADLPARRHPAPAAPPAVADDYGQTIAGDVRPAASGYGGLASVAFGSGFDEPAGGLTFIREIARGGMGVVHLARSGGRFPKYYAVKRMLAELADSEGAIDRFITEAKAAGSLDSPNLITVIDVLEDEQGPMIQMEYVAGPLPAADGSDWPAGLPNPPMDLDAYVKRCGPLGIADALKVIEDVAYGIKKAHAAGIVHRDIKPANILLGERLVPKLGDFGLARRNTGDDPEEGRTVPGTSLLTPGYGAPEQRVDATKADHRADLFALGGTLLFATTGVLPRDCRDADAPEAIRALVSKAMTHDLARRHQSADEFIVDLQAARDRPAGKSPEFHRPATHAAPGTIAKGVCYACGYTHGGDVDALAFCNDCGETVRAPCLKCNADNPVWAKRCGKCRDDVQASVDAKAQAFAGVRSLMYARLADYDLDQAKSATGDMLATTDPRLAEHQKWATAQREGPIKDREAEVKVALGKALKQAETMEAMQNYAAARRAVSDDLPAALRAKLRTPTIARFGGKSVEAKLAEIVATEARVAAMDAEIAAVLGADHALPPGFDYAVKDDGTADCPDHEATLVKLNASLDRLEAVKADHKDLAWSRQYVARRRREVEQAAFDAAERSARPETAEAYLRSYRTAADDLPDVEKRLRAGHVERLERLFPERLRATAFLLGDKSPALQTKYLAHRTESQLEQDKERGQRIIAWVAAAHTLLLTPLAAAAAGAVGGLGISAIVGAAIGLILVRRKINTRRTRAGSFWLAVAAVGVPALVLSVAAHQRGFSEGMAWAGATIGVAVGLLVNLLGLSSMANALAARPPRPAVVQGVDLAFFGHG